MKAQSHKGFNKISEKKDFEDNRPSKTIPLMSTNYPSYGKDEAIEENKTHSINTTDYEAEFNEKKALIYNKKGNTAVNNYQYTVANKHYDKALNTVHNNATALYNNATALYNKGYTLSFRG
eukprot:429856_1